MDVHGTATDPLAASTSANLTVAAGGATGLRTITTSFLEHRINWGNSSDDGSAQQGPDLVGTFVFGLPGPITLGTTMTMLENCRILGVRIFKHPLHAGTVPVAMWDATGTVLATVNVTWVADAGGYREILFSSPVNVTANSEYSFGYLYAPADANYPTSTYVWNNTQDTCVYPFLMKQFLGGTVQSGGAWQKQGASLTFSSAGIDRVPHNYYIDPIAQRDLDTPGYVSGTSYFAQFPNGGSRFAFPIAVYWADPPYHAGYKALGVNTILAGSLSDGGGTYGDSIVAADLDWYPTLHLDDMSAPQTVQEGGALASCVRGYLLTDEPEWNRPWNSPAVVRGWRDHCRLIDSTRPIYLNESRIVIENQGFTWNPAGVSAKDVNLQWREYMTLCDMGSADIYGINHTFPYTFSGADSQRYGIWIYPECIGRMREQITDERIPIWGVVETTSSYAGVPTPTEVRRCVWSMLIAGATGIEYFDHRFASPAVSQDFAAMLSDPAMSSMISALNAQMQSLAPALLAPEASLCTAVASSNTTAGPKGGYWGVPIHYSTRQPASTKYLFAQAIRPGATTGTFTIPSAPSTTLTVIGESRTVSTDGSGVFTDTFAADYEYHLYSW